MKVELIIGEKKIVLSENGKNKFTKVVLDSREYQIPVFLYLIQNVESHMFSMGMPTEEQSQLLEVMEQFESGMFEGSDEEVQEIMDKYEEILSDGICNQEIIDLGGIGLVIEGDKYKLEYFYDGVCPSEKISTLDGRVLSEISSSRIYISLMDGAKLCDFSIESVNSPTLGLDNTNSIEEFIKVSLNENTLTSVGVINNEFGDNQELTKAFKRIYAPAYTEKRNALKYMSSSYINEEGNFEFLSGVTQETVDRVAEAFPDILLLYSLA